MDACLERRAGWENLLLEWIEGDDHWLKRRCRSRLTNWFDAEDAVQDIIIRVIASIDRFERRSSLKTWVTVIADNHCYSMIRQRSARAINDHLFQCIVIHEHNRQTVHLDSMTTDRFELVQSTLQSLNADNREILELRFYKDLSLSEMASTLGMTLSATKMRLYRAINVFRVKYVNRQSAM